jgi:predicted  nucleic acid-binding Zn-ribbon protein
MRLIFLAIAITFSLFLNAQPDKIAEALYSTPAILVQEEQVTVGENLCSGFVSQVVSDDGQLEKYWKKYMKNSCGFSGKKVGGFYSAKGVFSTLSSDSILLSFSVKKDGDFSKLILTAKHKDIYVSSSSESAIALNVDALIKKGLREFYLSVYDQKINDQQKYYGHKNKDLSNAKKSIEKLTKEKSNASAAISKMEGQISSTKTTISKLKTDKNSAETDVELLKREQDQLKKENQSKQKEIQALEKEYNEKLMAGDLSEKKTLRYQEDIASEKEKLSKIEKKELAKVSEINAKETKVIEIERSISENEGKVSKLEADISNKKSDIERVEGRVKDAEEKVKETQKIVETALGDLERLKAAKSKLGM